jgi:hypothetical protein
MLCMYAWSHSLGPPTRRSARAEGAVHGCLDVKDFSLVLPGETHFIRVSIDSVESSTIHIEMALSELEFGDSTNPRRFQTGVERDSCRSYVVRTPAPLRVGETEVARRPKCTPLAVLEKGWGKVYYDNGNWRGNTGERRVVIRKNSIRHGN